ncbi:hypothetical protein AMTRI_Chr05g62520 [Amborella trichopoda]
MLSNNPLLLNNYSWECVSHDILNQHNPLCTLNDSFDQENLCLDVVKAYYRVVSKEMQHFLHNVHPHLPLKTTNCRGVLHHRPHKVSQRVGTSSQDIISCICFGAFGMGNRWWDDLSIEIGT